MANTTNLNLAKPAYNVSADIGAINGNMDIIDARMGAVPTNTSLQAQITAMTSDVSAKGKTIILLSTDDSWAKIWEKLNVLDLRETAPIYSHSTPTDVLSNGVRNTVLIGTVCKTSTSTFDFFVRYGTNNGAMVCRIEGVSSTSAGTYSERTVDHNYGGTTTTVTTQADLFALFNTKLDTMVNYSSALLQVSIAGDIPPFLSGARLMITLTRGASATYAAAIIQQAGSDIIATAGKSTTWTMHEIVRQSVLKQQEFTIPVKANDVNGKKVVTDNASMTVYMFVSFYNHVETWAGMWIVMFGSTSSNPTIKTIYSSSKISVTATAARQVTFTNNDTSNEGHVTAIRLAGAGELTLT